MDVLAIARLSTTIAETGIKEDVGMTMLKKQQDMQKSAMTQILDGIQPPQNLPAHLGAAQAAAALGCLARRLHHAAQLGVFEALELFVGGVQGHRQLGACVLVQDTRVLIGVLQQFFCILDDEAQIADQSFLRLRIFFRGFHGVHLKPIDHVSVRLAP
jgi:hypothetical protein